MKEIILTGIRANDEPTLGNFLGAMQPMVEMQKKYAGKYQINMFVPDLHSFTTPIDYTKLYANAIQMLKYYIASGLDIHEGSTYIYRQSFIPAHSELTVILNNFTSVGEMSRMTQFKEKARANEGEKFEEFASKKIPSYASLDEHVRKVFRDVYGTLQPRSLGEASVGLFDYPVLMAADILLYGARYVPVGEDQTQHLEITRDIGIRMNNKFAGRFPDGLFTIPEPTEKQVAFVGLSKGLRIRSLSDPSRKMSKSISDPKGTILLSDNPKQAAKKVMGATTDSLASIHFDQEKQPGITNLLQILSLLSERPQAEVNGEWEGKSSYGDLKKVVAATVETFLADFQDRVGSVDNNELLAKLQDNEIAMNKCANATLLRVQKAVGLRE